jgi:hypothetical protein
VRGEIHALPTLRGVLIASEGHLSVMRCDDGREVLVHNNFFKPDVAQPRQGHSGKQSTRLTAVEIMQKYASAIEGDR